MSGRYLTRVSGKFYFQIAVPAPLRDQVEGRRKVIKIALGTGDRRIASQLARPYVDFWLAEFDRLRGRPTPTLPEYAARLPERGYSLVRHATPEEVAPVWLMRLMTRMASLSMWWTTPPTFPGG